ncbi:MAG TPA: serine/threonine-protein kinase, partial [Kofleriaceae bacterium]|nr:serine/threonine-protein kinase [Kofleriaceae bacterium]
SVLMVFGLPMYWVKRRYDLREREKLQEGDTPGRKELEALRGERKLLLERLENLESIVCSVDYELNSRLARLAGEQSRIEAGDPSPARLGTPLSAAAPGPITPMITPSRPRSISSGASAGPVVESTALDLRRGSARRAPAEPMTDELQIGQMLDNRYRIDRLIGRGGMGAVYLAHDEVLDELVALKVVSAAHSSDPQESADRFRREASAARRVLSPNVIRIHDLGQTKSGLLYISMEHFAGRTLAEIIQTRGPLPLSELRDILGQVCDGLGAAHEAGVVHRDLKPQNVLVGERRSVKIIDFGLAKSTFLRGMTATGLIMGTPHYMAPEQVKGDDVGAACDIYALGALAFHAATGQPPFDGATPIAVGFAHLTEPPRDPRLLRPDLPEELGRAILSALSKLPRERPRSAEDFKRALG